MTHALPLEMMFALILLTGLVLSGLSVAHGQREQDIRRQRFADVLEPHVPQKPAGQQAQIVLVRSERDAVSLVGRVIGWFGILPYKVDFYPLPVWVLVSICGLCAFALAWFGTALWGPIGWVGVPVAWPLFSRGLLGWFRERRTKTLFRQLPDALSMIVRGVRVGIPVGDSVRIVAAEAPYPTAMEFRRLADELTIGVALEEALRNLARRTQLQEYRFFATAMALQSQTGGRLGETLENLADMIRKRVMVRARGLALAAETRTSSGVLGVLPFIAYSGLMCFNPAYALTLFTDPQGRVVLACALLSLGTGMALMRTMISRSLA